LKAVSKYPSLRKVLKIPHSLIIEAIKIKGKERRRRHISFPHPQNTANAG